MTNWKRHKSRLAHSQERKAEHTGICTDGSRCGERPIMYFCDNGYCEHCPNTPTAEEDEEWARLDQRLNGHRDVSAHYQREYKGILLDPYRIAAVYGMRGGPREQIMKKCLRFTDKGQTEQQVVDEIRSALERWQEMLEEDADGE